MPTIPRLKDQQKKNNIYLNQSAEYYNSKTWKDLRNYQLKIKPLCERCLAKGKVTAAEHVHHIIPFISGRTKADKLKLFTDIDNLMSLCYECHREIHREINNQRNETLRIQNRQSH